MREIRIYGDPVLRKKAKAIEVFDEELHRFVEDMKETMLARDGVGLAAPQVGESVRLAVVDTTGGEQPPQVLINPEVVESSDESEDYEEGCLSLPDINLKIKRPRRVSVRAQDARGHSFTVENAEGLLSRALQHEIDHLDGIMIVDHVSPLQRQMLSGKLRKLAKTQKAGARTA
jgi:peptide deformylase